MKHVHPHAPKAHAKINMTWISWTMVPSIFTIKLLNTQGTTKWYPWKLFQLYTCLCILFSSTTSWSTIPNRPKKKTQKILVGQKLNSNGKFSSTAVTNQMYQDFPKTVTLLKNYHRNHTHFNQKKKILLTKMDYQC